MDVLTLILFLTVVVIVLYYVYHKSSMNSVDSDEQSDSSLSINPKRAFKLQDIIPYDISYNYSVGTGPGLYGRGRHDNSLNF